MRGAVGTVLRLPWVGPHIAAGITTPESYTLLVRTKLRPRLSRWTSIAPIYLEEFAFLPGAAPASVMFVNGGTGDAFEIYRIGRAGARPNGGHPSGRPRNTT